ncbi:MAG: ABC-2 family transporter protein [Clostridia bacterium]|nr:ABC-2 family transporter protein [Clostridia bacterium]
MKLYFKYIGILFKSRMQYKVSFFMTAFGQFLITFTGFAGIFFLFERFHSVKGFDFPETLLCFATVTFSFSIAECFFRGFDSFAALIKSGELDRILIRPRGVIFQVLTSKMEFTRVGRFLTALFVFIYAAPASGVRWNAEKILIVFLMIAGGVSVFSGLFMIYAGFSFFTIEGLEFMNIFTDGTKEFGRYPLSIYGRELLLFYTFVIPIAPFQYYPFLYLIGQTDRAWYGLLPLTGFLFIIPALAFFRFGLRRYRSTGS